MSSRKISRRNFLKASALSGSGLLLSSCSHLDRIFQRDTGLYEKEVVIVGGGLAGLSAVYELKKNQIPYRLFEGSARMGGRIYTQSPFGVDGPPVELGAEWISAEHTSVQELANEFELKVESFDRNFSARSSRFWVEKKSELGNFISPDVFKSDWEQLSQGLYRMRLDLFAGLDFKKTNMDSVSEEVFAKIQKIDQLSLQDLIQNSLSKLNPTAQQIWKQSFLFEFGVSADQISALQVLMSLEFEKNRSTVYRIKYGNELLVKTLYDKTRSALSEYMIRTRTKLVEMRMVNRSWELWFDGPQGEELIHTDYLILALPIRQIRKIRGWKSLPLTAEQKNFMEKVDLSPAEKGALGFKNSFWKAAGSEPALFNQSLYIDSAQSPLNSLQLIESPTGKNSILSYFKPGRSAQFNSAEEIVQALNTVDPRFSKNFDRNWAHVNWTKLSMIEGAQSYFPPSTYSLFFSKEGLTQENQNFEIAGEFTNIFHGTMEGALRSGRGAAKRIAQKWKNRYLLS